jgi:hypothetical protein
MTEYEIDAVSRVCVNATICDAMIEYETAALTATTDRMCAAAKTCEATEYETASLTATTDRMCATAITCMSSTNCLSIDILRLYASSVTSLVNSVLTRVEKYVYFQYNSFTRVDLASLSYVGEDISVLSNELPRVDFASLSYVGGFFFVSGNFLLTRVEFASLTYIGGYLRIDRNPALTFASFSSLSQVQDILYFCQNNADFLYPQGITSVTVSDDCILQNGSESCSGAPFVLCPSL